MDSSENTERFSQWDFEYSFKFKKSEENFAQLWKMKSSARESLKDWLSVSNISQEVSEICANACSELIENCIKYTPNDGDASVAICVTNATIRIDTVNTATSANQEILNDFIAALDRTDDVKQLFVEKLLQPFEGKSHLGLIKTVMETKGRFELVPARKMGDVHLRLHMNVE